MLQQEAALSHTGCFGKKLHRVTQEAQTIRIFTSHRQLHTELLHSTQVHMTKFHHVSLVVRQNLHHASHEAKTEEAFHHIGGYNKMLL